MYVQMHSGIYFSFELSNHPIESGVCNSWFQFIFCVLNAQDPVLFCHHLTKPTSDRRRPLRERRYEKTPKPTRGHCSNIHLSKALLSRSAIQTNSHRRDRRFTVRTHERTQETQYVMVVGKERRWWNIRNS